MTLNRRLFIQGTLAAAATGMSGVALASQPRTYRRIRGANGKLRFGVIGFGGRGKDLISAIRKSSDAELVALCDADKKILSGFEADNTSLFRTQDYRELLDRKDIDVIASATPNHWHTLITMLACQAGKHVYIEKPISHNMHESRQVVAAARKFNRIVQCGFQNRSDSGLTPFYERLKAGEYGAVQYVHGTCHRQRDSIGKRDQPLEIPSTIAFDKWLGPAANQPIMRPRLHYDWHWDFNTGNGDVGNQGPHEWDLMNWALGDPQELPSHMVVAGNRFGWDDAGNTPNVMACLGELNGIPFCFEVMDLKVDVSAPQNKGVGVIIRTEAGEFVGGRGGGKFTYADGRTESFSRAEWQAKEDGTPAHMQNFIDAVAVNESSLLKADCAAAANSAAMAHMANISYRLGTPQEPESVLAAFDGSPFGREMISRLSIAPQLFNEKAEEATPEQPWILGPQLTFDNTTKKFTGDVAERANGLQSRNYRAGYELPKV